MTLRLEGRSVSGDQFRAASTRPPFRRSGRFPLSLHNARQFRIPPVYRPRRYPRPTLVRPRRCVRSSSPAEKVNDSSASSLSAILRASPLPCIAIDSARPRRVLPPYALWGWEVKSLIERERTLPGPTSTKTVPVLFRALTSRTRSRNETCRPSVARTWEVDDA